MSTIAKVQEILKDANQGEYVSLKCENDSTNINGYVVYLSKEKVDAIKLDDWTKGWPKEEPTVLGPLCFTAEEPNVKITFDADGEWPEDYNYLEYSTDGNTWNEYTGQEITLVSTGDKVYFNTPDGETNHKWGNEYAFSFKSTGLFAASGNIMSLVVKDCLTDVIPEEAYFYGLFWGNEFLTSAPALPATTLASYCYSYMFYGCTSLTTAPALPATTLASYCYSNMFSGCTSLLSAPALPAETLASNCYSNMFSGCTSLLSAPALPAETLASNCYYYMFEGCTEFSDCHMKAEMQGVYKSLAHGNTTKTVVYDL